MDKKRLKEYMETLSADEIVAYIHGFNDGVMFSSEILCMIDELKKRVTDEA